MTLTAQPKKDFNRNAFWSDLAILKQDYAISYSPRPSPRAAQRITILISTAYLANGGSVHWVQCLESSLYRSCKESKLDCDQLDIEEKWHKGTNRLDKPYQFNEYDEWHIFTTEADTPKSDVMAKVIANFFLIKEEREDVTVEGGG